MGCANARLGVHLVAFLVMELVRATQNSIPITSDGVVKYWLGVLHKWPKKQDVWPVVCMNVYQWEVAPRRVTSLWWPPRGRWYWGSLCRWWSRTWKFWWAPFWGQRKKLDEEVCWSEKQPLVKQEQTLFKDRGWKRHWRASFLIGGGEDEGCRDCKIPQKLVNCVSTIIRTTCCRLWPVGSTPQVKKKWMNEGILAFSNLLCHMSWVSSQTVIIYLVHQLLPAACRSSTRLDLKMIP